METTLSKPGLDEDLLRTWLDIVIKAQTRNIQFPDDLYMERQQRAKQILKTLERMSKYLQERS